MSALRMRMHPCEMRPGMSSGRSVPWMPTKPPAGQSVRAASARWCRTRPARRWGRRYRQLVADVELARAASAHRACPTPTGARKTGRPRGSSVAVSRPVDASRCRRCRSRRAPSRGTQPVRHWGASASGRAPRPAGGVGRRPTTSTMLAVASGSAFRAARRPPPPRRGDAGGRRAQHRRPPRHESLPAQRLGRPGTNAGRSGAGRPAAACRPPPCAPEARRPRPRPRPGEAAISARPPPPPTRPRGRWAARHPVEPRAARRRRTRGAGRRSACRRSP